MASGRIRLVGSRRSIAQATPSGTPVIDLAGRALVPGFQDAHFHFFQAGLLESRPSLDACGSREEALDAIRDAAGDLTARPGDDPLIVERWDSSRWPDDRPPTRDELDAIRSDLPILARRVCGHVAVGNRAGLRLLAARGGRQGIDFQTGWCAEGPVLAIDGLFAPSPEGSRVALETAGRLCLSRGITAVGDFFRRGDHARYRHFRQSARLPVRVEGYLLEESLGEEEVRELPPPTEDFAIRGVKLFADGSIGGRTAAVGEEYADRPGEYGILLYSDDELAAAVRQAHDRGMAVAVHAIGDRAIAQVLNAFGRLPGREIAARGHRIEHFELALPEHFDRLVGLGVRPCMQPNFVGRWAGPGGLYETALGRGRVRSMNRFRTARDLRTGVFFGSDGMPVSPLYGIRSAVHHPVKRERLDPEEALALYTAAATEVFPDRDTGRIEPGAEADLTVLPGGIEVLTGAAPDDGPDEVAITVRAGRIVHRWNDGEAPAPEGVAFPREAARNQETLEGFSDD
jgi:predicted amidohydrolase YtcJ